ncbi:MAG: hypothetical protein JJE07_10450 [Flavobacteriaceae bacterium]|nr:hypothetical protein [Flavobacteriaceae bacterium]
MEKPKKCISVEKAKALQIKWKESRAKDIDLAQGYQDTREFWYSVEELQEYLNYVKERSSEQGVKDPGIRIYFGAYPKSSTRKSYATVFLAPTKERSAPIEGEDETSINLDNNYEIDPLNESSGGMPPVTY